MTSLFHRLTRRDSGPGYKTLAGNLPKFADVGQLPIQVPLSHLDEEKGMRKRSDLIKLRGTNHVSTNTAMQG